MAPGPKREFLPVELILNPNWWNHAAGISFDESFYLDAETRIRNDVIMRRVLHERFGDMGLGEAHPEPRAVIGSPFVAGGFVVPALLGAEIRFAPAAAPQPLPVHLTPEEVASLEKPDFRRLWPMRQIVEDMDALEARFGPGSLVGDLNTDGLLNAAYHFCGQELFLDFYDAPERVLRLLEMIGELIVDLALYVRGRTGSCSISVNPMAGRVNPAMFVHANCSVQMISPESYRAMQLPVEMRMARRIQPYGIHHCGENLHQIAPVYAELPASFFDVGWGSDVSLCRQALPDAFLNLRLSPIRMLQCSPAEIAADTEKLLQAAGPLQKVGVCCINMDHGTPEENIFAMFEVVRRYRSYGA
jgi:uroporphyrinogen-III decarboxylase